MNDLETIVTIFHKAGIPTLLDETYETQKHFGSRELTVLSKSGPTKDCGYSGFYGVFFFNDNGDLTEFGCWE